MLAPTSSPPALAPRPTIGRRRRTPVAVALATAALSVAGADVAVAAAPIPCTDAGGGRFNCQFFPRAGAPVQAADGRTVGTLHAGTNWVRCQRVGGQVRSGAYFNNNWAWTLADNKAWGWVNAVYARGGDNDGRFDRVPDCGTANGNPPGASGAPAPAPAPAPGPAPGPVNSGSTKKLNYQYQPQQTGYWCSAGAARIALSARGKAVEQADLARFMKVAKDGGLPNIGNLRDGLNHYTGSRYYAVKQLPSDAALRQKLRADVLYNVDRGHAVVINVVRIGSIRYDGGHYATIVGYDGAGRYLVADPAGKTPQTQQIWLSAEEVASGIKLRRYVA